MADKSQTEQILGEDGEFHAKDDPIDLSGYGFEGWIVFVIFWALCFTVFYQFFTRYVMNDSASWTEEIARYLLIGVVFIGASYAVDRSSHVHVDLIYRYLPQPVGRVMSTIIDVVRTIFFGYATVLTLQMMEKMGSYRMTIIELPMNIVYGVCMFGFALATIRSVVVTIRNWRQGYSILERPETAIKETL